MVKRFLFFSCTVSCLLLCNTLLAAPTLSHSLPAALMPGKTMEISFHGKDLGSANSPLSLQTSFPAKVEFVSEGMPAKSEKNKNPQRNRVTYRITVAPETSIGIGAVWLACTGGMSDPLLVMLDDIMSQAEPENHHSLETAQMLKLPAAVDGTSGSTKSDFYKFKARKGERISVEIVAQRIASQFDGVMRLLDDDGREIAFADDDSSLGADARFSVIAKKDGIYSLQAHDVLYRNGLRYRLRIGDFPLVTVPYPLGGKLGTTTQLKFVGPAVEGLSPLDLRLPIQTSSRHLAVSARYSDGQSSAMATLVMSSLDERIEEEPNNEHQIATKINIPSAINGRLEKTKDRDFYEFTAKKDQPLSIKAIGRSLGSPSDLFMRIYDSDGKKLAETKGNSPEETLNYKIPADGIYRLMVEDLVRRSGPEHAYRVEITTEGTFSLSLKNDKNASDKYLAAKNGAIAVNVQCNRTGYQGPITLAVEGSDGTCQVHQNVIPEKGKETKMLIDLPKNLNEGDSQLLRIVGRASTQGKEQLVATAGTSVLLRRRWPHIPYPEKTLDGQISVAIVPDVKPFFSLNIDKKEVFLHEQAQLSINLKRLEKDFKQAITLNVSGLPQGVTSQVIVPTKDKPDQYVIDLKADSNLSPENGKIEITGYGEFKGRVRKEVLAEIPLEIVKPLSLTLEIEKLALSEKHAEFTIDIEIERFNIPGEIPNVVRLDWKNIPQGAKISGPQEIAVGNNKVKVEFSIDGSIPIGKLAEIVLQASTKFLGKEAQVQRFLTKSPRN